MWAFNLQLCSHSTSFTWIYTRIAQDFVKYFAEIYVDSIVIVKLLLLWHQFIVDTYLQHNKGKTIVKIDVIKTHEQIDNAKLCLAQLHTFIYLSSLTWTWKLPSWNIWPATYLPQTSLPLSSLWCEFYTLHSCVIMPSFSTEMSGNWHKMLLIYSFWILRIAPGDILLFVTIYIKNSRSYHQAKFCTRLWINWSIFHQL